MMYSSAANRGVMTSPLGPILLQLRQFKLPEQDHADAAVIRFHKLEWSADELIAPTNGNVASIWCCQQLYIVPLAYRDPQPPPPSRSSTVYAAPSNS